MKVAIVGAGIAGLSVAWRLHKAGIEPTIFEKSNQVGGRASTTSLDGYVWDDGATSIAPRGKSIEEVLLQELSTEGLVRIEKPIWVHDALRPSAGSVFHNSTPRFTYETGIAELPSRLAANLNVKTGVSIDEIQTGAEGYFLGGEWFDRLVLAVPLPVASLLLWSLNEIRPISNVTYRSCISILLGYDAPIDTPYHALVDPEQVHPMAWLSLESQKSPHRAPDGKSAIVLQLGARFSKDNYEKSDEFLVGTAATFVRNLYGSKFEHPETSIVKRWKYSQPDNLARFEAVNLPGSKVLIASDALLGGRIEEAFECGYRVGELIVNG